ncbi:MAG: hypothetical protein J2P45_32150, partial [Candidatus Dormibacteraeota bacterium]|nr:hypothetical protein [Candidatus Dormibacteraeota bacterium]
MNFDKQDVINHISQVAGPQQAQQAAQQLPDQVDPDQHGNMLQQFGVDPQRMASQLGGQSGSQFGGGGSGGSGGYQDPGQGGG